MTDVRKFYQPKSADAKKLALQQELAKQKGKKFPSGEIRWCALPPTQKCWCKKVGSPKGVAKQKGKTFPSGEIRWCAFPPEKVEGEVKSSIRKATYILKGHTKWALVSTKVKQKTLVERKFTRSSGVTSGGRFAAIGFVIRRVHEVPSCLWHIPVL